MLTHEEKRLLNKQKNRLGLFSDLTIKNDEEYKASINNKCWDITISLGNSIKISDKHLSHYYKKKKLTKSLDYIIARDLLYHEAVHWETCPQNLFNHHELLKKTSKSLSNKGINNDEINFYITNMFEDIIVNSFVRNNYSNHAGQTMFFYDQCIKNNELTDLYESFMKLSLVLWGDKHDKKLINGFYNNNEIVNKTVKKLKSLFDGKYGNNFLKETIWNKDLINKFIDIISPLINKEINQKQPLLFGSKSLDNKISSSNGVREIIFKDFNDKGFNNKLMEEFGREVYLDNIYRLMADKIELIPKSNNKNSSLSLPINYKPYQSGDAISKLNMSKIGFNSNFDCLVPCTNKGSIEIKLTENKIIKGIPDIYFIIDDSGSMGNCDVNNKSGYHYALLGFYGVINYLESIKLLNDTRFNICLFSDNTKTSGFNYYDKLTDAKKLLLNPESGNTKLNMDILNESLSESDNCAVIMLSDGVILNWKDIKFDFMKLMNNYSFNFISINNHSNTNKDLQDNGFNTYQVNNAHDLSGLIIDLAKKEFKGFS
ncbi:MAG: vWA domain-containing protein [Candidatus Nanoarchaeia archaeon]|jgi:hypothetical protein